MLNCPKADLPEGDDTRDKMKVNPALADLLRVLLKAKTESSGVASKLIAPSADLDAIAAGERDVAALSGWRREVFGEDALRLCEGRIALSAKGARVLVIEILALEVRRRRAQRRDTCALRAPRTRIVRMPRRSLSLSQSAVVTVREGSAPTGLACS